VSLVASAFLISEGYQLVINNLLNAHFLDVDPPSPGTSEKMAACVTFQTWFRKKTGSFSPISTA
jgi:hypothetical protein